MNYWIEHKKNEQLFARFDGNIVRAIFTPKYKPVDNMDVILEIYGMGYRPETQVQCYLDEEFISLSIMDGEKVFEINGDRFRPGVSISNSEVGLASLSVLAFILRLIFTNGMVSRTELSASYRQVSTKILNEFPLILDKVSVELGKQRHQIRLSMESPVDDPMKTIESFNLQFALNEDERQVVEWACPQEAGDTMIAVVNSYTRAAQFKGLIGGIELQVAVCWRECVGDVELICGRGNCPLEGRAIITMLIIVFLSLKRAYNPSF